MAEGLHLLQSKRSLTCHQMLDEKQKTFAFIILGRFIDYFHSSNYL